MKEFFFPNQKGHFIFCSVRVWKEIYLPVFEIINSLLVGFLFLATLNLTVESSSESRLIWNNYPELFVLSLISTLAGYILIGFLGKESIQKTIQLCSLGLIACLIWLLWIMDRPILVESIFFQKSFHSLIAGMSFMAGVLLADQKEVQKGGFLIGILIYFLSENVLDWHLEHLKILMCLYTIALLINYGFRNVLEIKNQFLPTRIVKKKYKYFQPIYHSFLILFMLMVGSQIYRGLSQIDLLVILYLVSYSLTRSFVIYKISSQIHRVGFIYGRYLLTISFICFSAIFSWSILIYPLVVMVAVGIAFFKPIYTTENSDSNAILLGALTVLISAIIIYLSKTSIYFIHLLAFLYLIVFFPIFKKTLINPIDKIIPVAIGLLFSIFLFQVPTRLNTTSNKGHDIPIFDPIPYKLSDLFDSNENFSYIRSNLPFVSRIQFPQEEEIEGTVPILGYNPDDTYLQYYSIFLREKKIPFYVIATNNQIHKRKKIPMLENLESVDYPGFKIFYPTNAKKPNWTNRLSRDWKFSYIQGKVGSLSNWDQVSLEFSTIEKYASSDLKTEMRNYRQLIHDSISQYCEFYYKNQRFLDTLECTSLVLKFGELDSNMKSISYQSLNFTTPNLNHIDVLKNLSADPEYKVSTLMKLFPIYDSLGDHKNTIEIISQLKSTLLKNEAYRELNELEIDEARMYLKLGKWEEANSAISAGQRKYPESILWQRMVSELEKWKQQRNKSWSTQPNQNPKGI
jgi:hypothetical protein